MSVGNLEAAIAVSLVMVVLATVVLASGSINGGTAMIRLDHVAWRVGAFALENISFTVPTGSYGVLMGRTGGGKTTVLEIICGLRRPTTGRVWLGRREVTQLAPGERGLGYVPQDGALFPTMTVREHLGFALRVRRRPAGEIVRRVEELAEPLGIAALLDRHPTVFQVANASAWPWGALWQRGRKFYCWMSRSRPSMMTRGNPWRICSTAVQRGDGRHRPFTSLINANEAARLANVLFRLDAGQVVESHARTIPFMFEALA